MSDNTEEQKANLAADDFEAYRNAFEKKHGYGIGATSRLTPDGRVETIMQLVKLPISQETIANELADTKQNGNSTTEETGAVDSGEQPEG